MTSVMRKRLGKAASWLATFVLMLIICVPGLWVVLTGFRPNREVLAKPAVWIPEDLTLDNFAKIFGFGAEQVAIPVPAYFTNSLIIALTSTAIAILIGMSGGYAFARFRFRYKDTLFLGLMLSRSHRVFESQAQRLIGSRTILEVLSRRFQLHDKGTVIVCGRSPQARATIPL